MSSFGLHSKESLSEFLGRESDFPMKGSIMNLEDVTTLHSQAECNSFQSYTYLFIYFPIFFLYPFHRRTLWNYGKAIFYPKAAGCHGLHEPYLSPGWFSLTETITGGRGWRKKEGRRNQILHYSVLFSSRNGAIRGVLGCHLWGPSVSWKPGMEHKLLWVEVVRTRWGKEVVYKVSGERSQMKRWLKRSQCVERWEAAQ